MPETMTGKLLRIFVDEADHLNGKPLYEAVIEALREAGFAGATVLKGIEGFGRHKAVRAARSVEFSSNLPVVIEVFEQEEKVLAFIPKLRDMIDEGLLTLENVQVLQWT
jgi:PII-like signaling protein